MAHWKGESAWLDEEDEFDPDYREDSETESDADSVPRTLARDRADWLETNVEEVAELYKATKTVGEKLFGKACLQNCNINKFANFVYKYTTPGAC